MFPSMTRRDAGRLLGSGLAASLALPHIARAAAPIQLRVSLDTAPAHMRNVSIADYLKKLEAASGGRIKTQLFSSGALFADLNVAKALVEGQVEMACPGSWTLTGFVPDCDFFSLPTMFGRSLDIVHRATDGAVGGIINDELHRKLQVQVLGPWLDLGFQNWYSATRTLKSYADLKGMKIRNSGGAGNAWRTRFFDAIPNTTAWPNVPLALSQHTFDGLITTNESTASAKLYEAGVTSSLQDQQSINIYIPLISGRFWSSLPPDLRALMVDTWKQSIPGYRQNMIGSQKTAYTLLVQKGVKMNAPSESEIDSIRKTMQPQEAQVGEELRLSPKLMAQMKTVVS